MKEEKPLRIPNSKKKKSDAIQATFSPADLEKAKNEYLAKTKPDKQ